MASICNEVDRPIPQRHTARGFVKSIPGSVAADSSQLGQAGQEVRVPQPRVITAHDTRGPELPAGWVV